MAANIDPIWTKTPKLATGNWTSSNTALTKNDGSATGVGTDIELVFTAGAEGSFVEKLRALPVASTAATATTATMLRVYVSTVNSGATTRDDTHLIAEIPCPAQTAGHATAGTYFQEIPIGMALESGQYLLVSMHHAAAANTSWQFLVVAGDY